MEKTNVRTRASRLALAFVLAFSMSVPVYAYGAEPASAESQGANSALAAEGTWQEAVTSQPAGYVQDDSAKTVTISSAEGLAWLASKVNGANGAAPSTFEGYAVSLTQSVDISAHKWMPIGTVSTPFKGAFLGGGFTIAGMTDFGSTGTNGLFGAIDGATIGNVKIEGMDLQYWSFSDADENKGAVAGYVTGTSTIDSVEVWGAIRGADYTGGIAGRPSLKSGEHTITISKCVNHATVSSRAKAGGIVGYARADVAGSTLVRVENCINDGTIAGKYAGGITGYTWNAVISNCVNKGTVYGDDADGSRAGGIAGNANSGTAIENCSNAGDVYNADFSGGILGSSASGSNAVSASSNTGAVEGKTHAGGIIGGSESSGDTISNCYNGGAVKAAAAGAQAGGIFGYNNSSYPVTACVNDGAVVADQGVVYAIGQSRYWYDQATGSKLEECYYFDQGTIVKASENGSDAGVPQVGMTRTALANTLNAAGGIAGFWQAQNGSVQPDQFIPGDYDEQGVAVAQVASASGIVSYHTTLDEAFATAADGDTVKLLSDATDVGSVSLNGRTLTVDLNGNSIGFAFKKYFNLSNGGHLMLTGNGEVYEQTPYFGPVVLKGSPEDAADYAVLEVGEGVTLKGWTGIFIDRPYGGGVVVRCDGDIVTVRDSDGYAGHGVYINGSIQKTDGNVAQITMGKTSSITGVGNGIYAAGYARWELNGDIEGDDALSIKSGEIVINSGTYHAFGAYSDPVTQNNGSENTGSAVSITSNDNYAKKLSVTVNGGTFVSDHGYAFYEGIAHKDGVPAAAESFAAIAINDGEFTGSADKGALTVSTAKDKQVVSGGTFNSALPEELCAEGFVPVHNPDGTYGVQELAEGQYMLDEYKGGKAQEDWTYPHQPGKAFAGWYQDASFAVACPESQTTGLAYAKFVDAEGVPGSEALMWFKGGSLRLDYGETYDKASLRLGYEVNLPEGAQIDWAGTGWNYAKGDSPAMTGPFAKVKNYAKSAAGADYVANLVMTGIPAKAYSTQVRALMSVAYWTDDGTHVVAMQSVDSSRSVLDVAKAVVADPAAPAEQVAYAQELIKAEEETHWTGYY